MATAADPERGATKALELALRYLNRRERTRAQVAGHLSRRELPAAAIEEAVATLARQGHLDDARYARAFAEDRRALDGWGPERIERALVAAGVDDGLVADAVGARDAGEELEAALELLRRRFREIPGDDRERASALGMLVRKGYDLDLAYEAVRAFERAESR
ncbi:MAG TPA: RecX family transcriptional regulator [Solirubrobacteraceae bacterium]|nr:RecX family transcriptional regulator [Solirubrobacteraceae bacterium]